jgi:BASS family bile acid:Na+ symporter
MTYTPAQLLAPLKRVWLVVAVVGVNAAAIPAIAWLVAEALPISDVYVSGLVLATLGAGSAAALKGAQLAERADLPLAVSLVVVLQLSNIVAVPLWAGRVVSGASLSAWDILKSLLALVLIPLVVGLLVRARYPEHAQHWTAGLVKVANLALLIALAAGITVNWATIVGMFGSWVLVASIVIIAVSVLL